VGVESLAVGSSAKRTVIAGSCFSRVALSMRVSKFETGVCAAHEYGSTRTPS